jgi:hypothetical protein
VSSESVLIGVHALVNKKNCNNMQGEEIKKIKITLHVSDDHLAHHQES